MERIKGRAIVTGGSSGLGLAIRNSLLADNWEVLNYDIKNGDDVCSPEASERLFDFTSKGTGLDLLVNCAGINGINWMDDVTEHQWDRIMNTNAKGLFCMTQHLKRPLTDNRGAVINIVSNAAHMPMRCSAAYNASKGAALILTKQMARELIGDGITVFSVSPNKLSGTEMSKQIDNEVVATRGWTMEQAQEYQMQGLLTGQETMPEQVAEFIAFLVSKKHRHAALAGCDLQYGL